MKFLLVALVILLAGCGCADFKMVPVSGTITMDGEPLEGVEVVFAPMEIQDQIEVGPISIGVTDSNGKFTLNTTTGIGGAVATNHRVSVSFGELDEAAIAAKVDEAVQKNRGMPEAQVMALENKVRRSMMVAKPIPDAYNRKTILQIELLGATDEANFELKSDPSLY